MKHPQLVVVIEKPARVVQSSKGGEAVSHAVAVFVDTAHDGPASWDLVQRSIGIHADEDFTRRRRRDARRVTHVRRRRKKAYVELRRRFDSLEQFPRFVPRCHGNGGFRRIDQLRAQHREFTKTHPRTLAQFGGCDAQIADARRLKFVFAHLAVHLRVVGVHQQRPGLAIG